MARVLASSLVLLTVVNLVHSSRILGLFPHPGKSHYAVFNPLMEALSKRGHDVTVVSYFPQKNTPNRTDLKFDKDLDFHEFFNISQFYSPRGYFAHFRELIELSNWGKEACQYALFSKAVDQVLDLHQQQRFDLVITEYFNTDCLLGVIHKMNVPFVGLTSCSLMPWHFDRIGAPDTPSYIPSEFVGYNQEMTWWERFVSFTITKSVKYLYRNVQWSDNRMNEKKFKNDKIPDVAEIAKATSFIFVNQHFSLHGPRAIPPGLIEVGGIHLREPKTLPDNLKRILDGSKHGVIIMSWGSMIKASTMTDKMRESFIKAFGEFKEDVIWKYEDDIEVPENVHLSKWLPQFDILCHPNVKLFISHCGMLGATEAAFCGVPVIGVPFYGDQPLNSAALEQRKMGLTLKPEHITYEVVKQTIQKVLEPQFKASAQAVSKAFKERPHQPIDTAVYWTEYAIKIDPKFVLSHARNLNWFIFYSFDIILPILGVILLIIFILKKLTCSRKVSMKTSDQHKKIK